MVRVAVIGSGVLGIKVAGSMAYDGHEVRINDNDSVLNKVYLRLNEDKRMLRQEGLLLNENFVGDVYCFTNMQDAVRGADFIFESVPEDMKLKKEVFEKVESFASNNAIIATSSMRLPIDDIIENSSCKDRCLGIRFLYPVYFIPEVELIVSKHTSLDTLERVRLFLEQMNRIAFFRSGSEPIVLNDEQREARKSAYINQMNEKKGSILPVPDLGSINSFHTRAKENGSKIGDTISATKDDNFPTPKDNECVVCMDSDRDCVLHPCHHFCTCITCGRLLLKRQDACPICRRTITNAFRVYHS